MHALKRMEKLGWVEQTNPRSSSNREGRIYELTHNGAVQLDMELDRMSAVVEKGRYKLRTHRQTMLPFDPDVMIGI
jgi:DNA-binding PadR family transcriptional regulator